MSRRLRQLAVTFLGLTTTAMSAAPEPHRNFVACPIVRDTSTVPCWLAEHNGELYFLTLQTDVSAPVNPPQLGHRVLVEGVVSNEPRICGGVVLKPVVLSVLPELDNSCSTVLPAEERYNLTFEAPRPPGPSKGRLAFDPSPQVAAARPAPDVAAGPRTFALQFDFDGLVAVRHAQQLQQIREFALKSNATRIEITAYRAASLLSDDTFFTEREDIGQRRAQQLAALLRDSGLNVTFDVTWRDAVRPDGVNDAALRRADVTVR
jgi:hypothetical protein